MTLLEKAQSKYIEFLEERLNSVEVFLSIHHHKWSKEEMKKGRDLREKLKLLKK